VAAIATTTTSIVALTADFNILKEAFLDYSLRVTNYLNVMNTTFFPNIITKLTSLNDAILQWKLEWEIDNGWARKQPTSKLLQIN